MFLLINAGGHPMTHKMIAGYVRFCDRWGTEEEIASTRFGRFVGIHTLGNGGLIAGALCIAFFLHLARHAGLIG
jgi:hypothetical protein